MSMFTKISAKKNHVVHNRFNLNNRVRKSPNGTINLKTNGKLCSSVYLIRSAGGMAIDGPSDPVTVGELTKPSPVIKIDYNNLL